MRLWWRRKPAPEPYLDRLHREAFERGYWQWQARRVDAMNEHLARHYTSLGGVIGGSFGSLIGDLASNYRQFPLRDQYRQR